MTASLDIQALAIEPNHYVPNNQELPFLIYHKAWQGELDARKVLAHFASNGWGGGWVNGVFPFHHYHAQSHEVLANTGPTITVKLGGPDGKSVEFRSRDVIIIPAGGGHCLVSDGHASGIVGAYPTGQEDWDLKRNEPTDYELARQQIPQVPLPTTDPLTGTTQPLSNYWKRQQPS